MDDLSKMSLEELAKRAVSSVPRRYYGHILAELRRRDEAVKALVEAARPIVEQYNDAMDPWHSIPALRSALSAFQEPVKCPSES